MIKILLNHKNPYGRDLISRDIQGKKPKRPEYFSGENLVELNSYICECQYREKTKFWPG